VAAVRNVQFIRVNGDKNHEPSNVELIMSIVQIGSFFRRVANNDSFRKGVASAVAGVLVATVMESIWGASS
jgi:riboflavin transporter FmnP